MIKGTGIDIIEISRIKESIEKFGDHFVTKIFSPSEQKYCEAQTNKYQHYAARFAAKEAIAKAVGTGWGEKITWADVEVLNDIAGAPYFNFLPSFSIAGARDDKFHLSLTHSRDYAAAVVIWES